MTAATGGDIDNITDGGTDYTVHTFTSSGTLTFSEGGSDVEYLVVAGGGGSNRGVTSSAGAGAGGLLKYVDGESNNTGAGFLTVTATAYTMTVGDGGAGGLDNTNSTALGSKGQNSTAFDGSGLELDAEGGGNAGFTDWYVSQINGGSGGSGGGAVSTGVGGSGNAGPPRQGFDGGIDTGNGNSHGGGGGAGQAGADGNNNVGGHGGDGISSSITGTAGYYAGGGGGNGYNFPGSGGLGGGGDGGTGSISPTQGVDGKGGGAGAGRSGAGLPGGSGIIIVRYPTASGGGTTDYPSDFASAVRASDTFGGVVTAAPQSFSGDISVSARAEQVAGAVHASEETAEAGAARAGDSSAQVWAGIAAAIESARAAVSAGANTASDRATEAGAARAGDTASAAGDGNMATEPGAVVAGTTVASIGEYVVSPEISIAVAGSSAGGAVSSGPVSLTGTLTSTALVAALNASIQASSVDAEPGAGRAAGTANSVQGTALDAEAGAGVASDTAFIGSAIPLSMASAARASSIEALSQYDGAPDIRARLIATADASVRTDTLGTAVIDAVVAEVIDTIQASGLTLTDGALVSFTTGGVNSAQRLTVTGRIEVESRTIRLHIESLTPALGIERIDT